MGQRISDPDHKPELFILSGPREIGKTTFLKTLLEQARTRGIHCAGVLSPAVFEARSKIAIDLLDVHSDEQKRLANLRHSENEGVFTDHWLFDPDILDLGNQILGESTPCELLIVDELGPIELERGQGWQNGIQAINSMAYSAAVVVIRPELLAKARSLWPQAQVIELDQKVDLSTKENILRILSSF